MIKRSLDYLSDIVGRKHEVSESVKEALQERIVSPFYGYFLISWLVVNWDYLYSALFLNGEHIYQKTGLLKDEYLLQIVLPEQYGFPEYYLQFIVYPLVLTFVVFWLMPVVTHKFYQKHLRNKIQMEAIFLRETAAEVEAESKLLKAEAEQAEITRNVEKVSPETIWEREYEKFRSSVLFDKFSEIIESVYNHKGLIRDYDYVQNELGEVLDSELIFRITQEILVFADSNELVEIDSEKQTISLTPKGKHFVKLYNFDKNSKAPF